MGTVASIDAIRLQHGGEETVFHLGNQDDAKLPRPYRCIEVHVPHDVSRCVDVLFICNEWGSSKGGLSTFNRGFAVNLAKASTDKIKVHCYVCSSSEKDREDAREQGVNLMTARRLPGSNDPMEWLKMPPSDLPCPHVVVGHGRKFGGAAHFISDRAKCWWIQFVHVFCEALGKYKLEDSSTSDPIAANQEKHKQELELCEAADLVVAVGSQLQRKYNRTLPDIKVEAITPGIFERFVIQSNKSDKFQPSEAEEFSIFMFGRGSSEDFELKGYDIIGKAVASLGRKFELTYVGSPHGEQKRIQKWFVEETKIAINQLTIRGYCDYEEIKKMFREADVIVMPSRTEGFGLVALEAISAGVPVLVSYESGIAEVLKDVQGGRSVVVNSNMPEEWARRIQGLCKMKPEERHRRAINLREQYGNTYSWQKECERFEQMIHELVQRPCKAVSSNLSLTGERTTVKLEGVVFLDGKEAQMNKEGAPVLLTGSKFVGKDKNEWNSLHSAALQGDVTKIESLLSLGLSIDSRDDQGITPLMIAAANDKLQAVEYLLGKGADPCLKDNNGWTSLHWASQAGNTAIIELMLSHVPSIDSITNKCSTALMFAAAKGKLQAVECLLTKGADPSLKDNNGWSSLHGASQGGNTAVIEKILSYGVDIESRTRKGSTPLMIAQRKGKAEAVAYLLSKGAKPS